MQVRPVGAPQSRLPQQQFAMRRVATSAQHAAAASAAPIATRPAAATAAAAACIVQQRRLFCTGHPQVCASPATHIVQQTAHKQEGAVVSERVSIFPHRQAFSYLLSAQSESNNVLSHPAALPPPQRRPALRSSLHPRCPAPGPRMPPLTGHGASHRRPPRRGRRHPDLHRATAASVPSPQEAHRPGHCRRTPHRAAAASPAMGHRRCSSMTGSAVSRAW